MKQALLANSFVIGSGIAVLLAALAPEIGVDGGRLPTELLRTLGIFAVFYLQGLSLSFAELRKGLAEWKLHLCIQTTTFLFFPVAVLTALALVPREALPSDLRLGFIYLSIVPTTIASAIAFTASSNGNVSAALFNTTLSNVGGVFLVPILCVAFLGIGETSNEIDLQPVLMGIVGKVIIPLIIGQTSRRFIQHWAGHHKALIRRFNHSVILFIIYTAFCESFAANIWAGIESAALWFTFLGTLLLLISASAYAWLLSGFLRFDHPSRITALYCGSQKTLAVGLPLAVMIFGQNKSMLGLLIVPLLIYHPAQLILAGWLSPRLARS